MMYSFWGENSGVHGYYEEVLEYISGFQRSCFCKGECGVQKKVIEKITIEDSGEFLSYLGTKEWL